MKKALVTGGAGFIGTNLIKKLLTNGYEVVSVDNYTTGFESNHQEGCTYITSDITNISDYSSLGDFDIVYHLAAIARIQPSFILPVEYFNTNAMGTIKLAKYCADKGIPLVFAGSSSHHSGKFKNPYTFSKDIGEEIILLFHQIYKLKASVARFYNVYGPHQLKEGGYCTVIGKWEHAIENGTPITIYGTGEKRRDFTHVDDITDALLEIETQKAYGHVFEFGRGINYSINEVADMFNYPSKIYEADKPGEADVTLCDSRLAREVLGWEPTILLSDYINSL